jgi:hypothetical protein
MTPVTAGRFELPPHPAQELVAIANQRDSDNISLQLIRVRGVEPVGM